MEEIKREWKWQEDMADSRGDAHTSQRQGSTPTLVSTAGRLTSRKFGPGASFSRLTHVRTPLSSHTLHACIMQNTEL